MPTRTVQGSPMERAEKVTADGVDADSLSLEQFLTYRLLSLTNRLNRQAVKILDEAAGLRLPEWRCLAFVGLSGRISLNEIAERTQMDRGLISRSMQGLVEKGIVLVERDTRDRRVVFAGLTKAGRRVHAAVLPRMRRRQARLLASLSESDRKALYRIIDRLNDCLDAWPGDDAKDGKETR